MLAIKSSNNVDPLRIVDMHIILSWHSRLYNSFNILACSYYYINKNIINLCAKLPKNLTCVKYDLYID